MIKALKTCSSSSALVETNVNKLDAWFKTIRSMLYIQAPYVRAVLDSNKVRSDRYQVCKMMLDLNVPAAITDSIESLDLNYPSSKRLFNNAVEALNAINSTRIDFAEHFQLENDEDEDDVDDESDKEEPSNMFRNSALGMYDVDDIEEDDEEDEDSLIGDGDAIAYVDGDDGGFEVIFTDEERSDHDHLSSGSESESDSDSINEEDYSSTGMSIDINENGSYGEHSDNDGFSDNSSFTSSGSGDNIEIIDVDEDDYESGLDVDLSDYNVDESDWDSGLSDLSSFGERDSEDDDEDSQRSERTGPTPSIHGHRWTLTDDVDISDEESDEESRGVFQGIEHIFDTDQQSLLRVAESLTQHNRHSLLRDSQRSHHPHARSSLSILGGSNRRLQNTLINPLGPSGLEQVENDMSAQLTSVGSGIHPRTERTHFADVLFSGETLDDRIVDGIVLKSSIARWKDIYDMFYETRNYSAYLLPTIINKLYTKSLNFHHELDTESQSSQEKVDQPDRTRSVTWQQPTANGAIEPEAVVANEEHMESDEHDPVYVNIEGTDVDIGGTDIDPEFLSALPEEIRAEVFTQHVLERRSQAVNHEIHSREIAPDFLNAIPEDIRNEIVSQEMVHPHFNVQDTTHSHTDNVDESLNTSHGQIPETINASGNPLVPIIKNKKPSQPLYFAPMLDRSGIAALMKSLFISQPYIQREVYHELFLRLCCSKQNRNDIVNMLLFILTEGINDQHSLERVYSSISIKAHGNGKLQGLPVVHRQLPADCTPLTVANQTIEILHHLLDGNPILRYFFITEHESLLVNKSLSKNKKDLNTKYEKWPIKYLFTLLDKKIITDETVLMDLLIKILQLCTNPIRKIQKNSNKDTSKRKLHVPVIDVKDLTKLVNVIRLDSCNTKVFQQTLNVMYNLLSLEDSIQAFTNGSVTLANSAIEASFGS